MIDPKELRIGNYIRYNGLIKQVYEVRNDDPTVTGSNYDVYTSRDGLQPIPLTPEILEKAGFTKKDWDGVTVWQSNLANINFAQDKDGYQVVDSDRGGFPIYIGHSFANFALHQLQNLNFALTGEELYIEL